MDTKADGMQLAQAETIYGAVAVIATTPVEAFEEAARLLYDAARKEPTAARRARLREKGDACAAWAARMRQLDELEAELADSSDPWGDEPEEGPPPTFH
jgi:hypothetical protein